MKKGIKKGIKISVISLISLIALITIVTSLAFYIILTPARLTPIVEQIAKEYIDAKLDFNEIDLTIISTFPNLGVQISDGLLRSTVKDSVSNSDTIVSFKSAEVVFNPLKLIFANSIEVNRVILNRPHIYAFVDSVGKANWDVFKLENSDDDTTKFDMVIDLDKFKLTDGKITYDDRQSRIFGRIKRVDAFISGHTLRDSKVEFDLKLDTALFWQDGNVLARRLNVQIQAKARNISNLKTLFIDEMSININNLNATVTGDLSDKKLNLKAAINTDSIASVFEMIPKAYLQNKSKFKTTGRFKADLDVSWIYDEKPIVLVNIFANNLGLHYDGFKYGLDDFDAELDAKIDLTKKSESYINITNINVDATALKVDLKGKIEDALGRAKFDLESDIDINFDALSQTLPFGDSVEMGGTACFKGHLSSNLNDVSEFKWQKFNATGDIELTKVLLIDRRKNFSFTNDYTKVHLNTLPNGVTELKGHLGDIEAFKEGNYDIRMIDSDVSLEIFKIKDSISQIKGEVGFANLALSLPQDSVILSSTASVVTLDMTDWLKLNFKTDTLGVDMARSKAILDSAYVDARVSVKKYNNRRRMGGNVDFKQLAINSNYFPLPIAIGSTKLSLKRDVIDLSKVDIRVGSSRAQISGSAEGVLKANRTGETMKIKGVLTSKNLDINEIMAASLYLPFMQDAPDEEQVEAIKVAVDSTILEEGYPLFVIPKNIDANLTVSIDTLKFGDIVLDNTRGGIQIADQVFRIRRIVSHFSGSQFAVRALYRSNIADSVDLTFAVDAKNIDVKKVTTMFPYLDSLTPIIRSVDGYVDFDFVAHTDFYKRLNIDIARFDASIMMTAQKVEVPDNETLRSVAKMLMFKNKKITRVDSVSLQMLAQKGEVEILPFIMDVDRYKIAVAGTQKYTDAMDMDYHVSVLKSPIPIKFGVNISGNLEDWSVGIGKTKYKYLQGKDYKGYVNPEYNSKRKLLFAPLIVQRRKD